MEDPKEIAQQLTKAQREMLAHGSFPAWQRESRNSRVKNALVTRGLAIFRHVIAGRGDFHLTPLGIAVREALLTPTREDQSHD